MTEYSHDLIRLMNIPDEYSPVPLNIHFEHSHGHMNIHGRYLHGPHEIPW